jgi:large subunit ribosomal protein L21
MFAVIKTGGLQYSVAEDQKVRIGRIEGEPGQIVQIGNVLMLGGDKPQLGTPIVSGASVAVEIIEQSRGAKVIAFKKRRRQNSRRKRGHRQEYTVVRISEILTGGAAPTKGPKPKPERKPAPVAADGEEGEAKPAAKKKAAAKKPAAKAKAPAKKPAAKKKKA